MEFPGDWRVSKYYDAEMGAYVTLMHYADVTVTIATFEDKKVTIIRADGKEVTRVERV
jgi:hypothetical protein